MISLRLSTRPIIFTTLALVFTLIALMSCASAENPIRHDFPKVGEYEVLSGDFHMHTINSDGRLTTRERVEESYQRGYDVISVTDHGTPRAYRVAKYVAAPLGIIVLRGLEITIPKMEHINVFGISETFDTTPLRKLSETKEEGRTFYQDAFRLVAEDGGILIYNHPHVGYREPMEWGAVNGLVCGVEIKNEVVGKGWNTVQSHGAYWYPEAFNWALKHNLTLFADTDVHGKRSDYPVRTLLLVKTRDSDGVMEAIKSRRTLAYFDGMLCGREALLTDLLRASVKVKREGDRVTLENLSPVALKGSIENVSDKSFELPAYQSAVVDAPKASGKLKIRWTNVWTSPENNLIQTLE